MSQSFPCPVCTFPLDFKPYATWPPPDQSILTPPYFEQLGDASYGGCALCGYEFGFDDNPVFGEAGSSFETYRSSWLADGMPILDVRAVNLMCATTDFSIPTAERLRGVVPAIEPPGRKRA